MGARETREKTRKGMRGAGWEAHVASRDPTLDVVGTRSCAIRRGMSKKRATAIFDLSLRVGPPSLCVLRGLLCKFHVLEPSWTATYSAGWIFGSYGFVKSTVKYLLTNSPNLVFSACRTRIFVPDTQPGSTTTRHSSADKGIGKIFSERISCAVPFRRMKK